MKNMEFQHIQLFRALLQGFAKAEGAGVQFLDLSSGEICQKEPRLMENRLPAFRDREMEQFLSQQQDKAVIDLLTKCRLACNQMEGEALEQLPIFQNELLVLRMFLRYLLKRAEGICQVCDSSEGNTSFQPQVLSTDHMLNRPVSQADSPEEYYPVFYVNKTAMDFLLPYSGAYVTHALFDSMAYALPISLRGLLVFVHASLHKYFYDGLVLTVQLLEDDAVVKRMNEEALHSEQQSGMRLLVGGQNELRRIQKMLQRKQAGHDAVELELG